MVRKIALALPEVAEHFGHGAFCFFIRDKQSLCYYHDNHKGDGRVSLRCHAYPDVREELIRDHPKRFFRPQTSSSGALKDWLGIYLDTLEENDPDWRQIAVLLKDAYCKVAPKKLIAELDHE